MERLYKLGELALVLTFAAIMVYVAYRFAKPLLGVFFTNLP